MTDIASAAYDDASLSLWLRSAGLAAIAAAALGSVLFAGPAMPDSPATDSSCRTDVVGGSWIFRGCDDPAGVSAP